MEFKFVDWLNFETTLLTVLIFSGRVVRWTESLVVTPDAVLNEVDKLGFEGTPRLWASTRLWTVILFIVI